jgi:hypothetical protein
MRLNGYRVIIKLSRKFQYRKFEFYLLNKPTMTSIRTCITKNLIELSDKYDDFRKKKSIGIARIEILDELSSCPELDLCSCAPIIKTSSKFSNVICKKIEILQNN